ncbi:hypothetical protein FRX31_016343, partial [Thalictrum thalictroides]
SSSQKEVHASIILVPAVALKRVCLNASTTQSSHYFAMGLWFNKKNKLANHAYP